MGGAGLTFAAADSVRLAVRTVSLSESSEARHDLLIPARTLLELARILPGFRAGRAAGDATAQPGAVSYPDPEPGEQTHRRHLSQFPPDHSCRAHHAWLTVEASTEEVGEHTSVLEAS